MDPGRWCEEEDSARLRCRTTDAGWEREWVSHLGPLMDPQGKGWLAELAASFVSLQGKDL